MYPTHASPSSPTRRRQLRLAALVVTFSVAAGAVAGPVLGGTASALLPTAAPSTGSPPGWAIERLSTTPAGEQPDGASKSPAISADGHHVSYVTEASDLAAEAMPAAASRIVVEDLRSGSVEHVSIDPEGASLAAPTAADVSADGSVVAMISAAENARVLLRDRIATSTTQAGLARVQTPAIDDAGSRVVFAESTVSNERQTEDIWLHEAGAEIPEVRLSQIVDNYEKAGRPSISADGMTVAFDTHVAEFPIELRVLDVSDLSEVTDVDDIPVRATIPGGRLPDVDRSGQHVAYASFDADGTDRIVIRDLATGTDLVVAELAEGLRIADVVISADGSAVAYSAAVMTGGEDDEHPTGPADLVVVDLTTLASEVIAVTDATHTFDLGDDGRTIVFSTAADGVVPGDSGGTSDVFVARRVSLTAPTWPADARAEVTDVGSTFLTVSWPAATDDVEVTNYQVVVDGVIAAQLAGVARGHTVTGLTPASHHAIEIVAIDAEGNGSAPLSVDATTAEAPETPGTASLTVMAGPGGRVRLSWDPAGPDTSYVVSRASGDGEYLPVADVAAGTFTFTDTALAAATEYSYRIEAVDGAVETHHSVERSTITPALAIVGTTWQGRPRVGGTIEIDVRADAGWNASAEVEYTTWYGDDGTQLESPRTLTTTVPAVEDVGIVGRYAASFALVEGIAQIVAVRGVVSDGHGASMTAAAPQPATAVRGALHLVIDPATDPELTGRVVVDGIAQRPLGDWADWSLEAVAAGVRNIRVLDEAGRVMAETTVNVVDGRRIDVELAPRQLGLARVRLVDGDAVPVVGAAAEATLVASGVVLGTVTSDRLGNFQVPGPLFVGDEVELAITPPAGTQLSRTVATVTAVAGDERVDVTVESDRTAVLQGRITLDGAAPAVGARVVISQTSNGTSRSFRAVTDDDGRYTVHGVAGPATVVVNYRQDPTASMGTVVLGDSPTTGDFSLAVAGTYRIVTTLSTRTMDDATWVPVDINPLNAWHFRLTLDAGRTKSMVNAADTVIKARPGDVVTICADGKEFGMSDACQTVTLGDDTLVLVDLRIGAVGRVTFDLVDSTGAALHPALQKNASLLRRTDGGSYESVAFEHGSESSFDMDLADPGHYRLVIGTYLWAAVTTQNLLPSSMQPVGTGRTVEFDVEEGQVVDLGAIALGTSRFATRSDVTVVRPVVPVGGVAEVRAALRPDAPGTHTAMSARLTIPAGSSVVPGSITADGAAVEATMDGDVAVIALGDRTFTADDEVVIRYRLTTDGIDPGVGFNAFVNVRSTTDGSTITGLAGSPTVMVAGVSIDGPQRSTTNTVVLSGLAPANTVVRITEDRQELGRAVATAGGRWRLSVTLTDFGPGAIHPLIASVTLQDDAGFDQVVSSRPLAITVDPRFPELVGVSLVQRNGNTDGAIIDIDPRDGVAHVPYVFRGDPGTLSIETQFAGRGEVESVDVSVGSVHAGPAQQIGDDRFRSNVTVRNTELGGVYASFEAVPDALTASDVSVPTEEELRSQLPAEFADAPMPEGVEVVVDESTGTRTAQVSPAIPGLDGSTTSISVSRGVLYTPTATDLAKARRAGVTGYGLVFEVTRNGDLMTATGSVLIPESALEEGTFAPSLNGFGVVRMGFQTAWNWGSAADGVIGNATAFQKYDRIAGLQDYVNRKCPAAKLGKVKSRLDVVMGWVVATDFLKSALQLTGFLVAPATLGLGTIALWAAGAIVDKLMDAEVSEEIDRLEAFVKSECEEEEEEDPYQDWPEENQPDPNYDPPAPPAPPLLDPVWIHDPSGYVYEGVPSNRISGVTATLTYSPTADGPFEVWDAEWFGQSNPLVTDGAGAYGWDVPEGFWQVVYTMDGYESARSEVLEVLPPHFDVNVGLARFAPPAVESVEASSGSGRGTDVTVTFDNYMRLDAGDLIEVTDASGAVVEGTVVAVDEEEGPDGTFASTFRFDAGAELSGELTVTVGALASDHAGRPMVDDFSSSVAVVVDDRETPTVRVALSPAPNGSGWSSGPVDVGIRAEDSGSGVASVDWTASGAVEASGSERGSDVIVPVHADGVTTVRSTATDAAGNVSEPIETTVRIDTVAPVAAITSPAPGRQVPLGAALVAGFDCVDPGTGSTGSGLEWCTARLGDGTVVAAGSALPTGTAGPRTVEVTARDVAGNVTTATVTYEVTAPPVPPSPKATIKLIDDQVAAVRQVKLTLVRELALMVPLTLAKVAVSVGARGAACAAIQLYDELVTSYTSKKWLTAAQSTRLHAGATTIHTALAC